MPKGVARSHPAEKRLEARLPELIHDFSPYTFVAQQAPY